MFDAPLCASARVFLYMLFPIILMTALSTAPPSVIATGHVWLSSTLNVVDSNRHVI